jgi:PII-like signaling protein
MQPEQQATLLRVFVGERDRHGHHPLYEAIVTKAREHGLAGATVLRGLSGFGASSVLHTAKLVELSDDLPMVVEIVDTEEHIEQFLPVLDDMMSSGLVTLEKVRVLQYGLPKKRG